MKVPNTLIIAEKNSQAADYAKTFKSTKVNSSYMVQPCSTFPNGAIIVHGIGFLLNLQEPHLYDGFEHLAKWTIEDTPFKIPLPYKYVPSSDKSIATHLFEIKKIVRNMISIHGASSLTVITATDQDNAGSNIAHTIYEYCFSEDELKQITFKRLFINSLEQTEIFKGFNNLHNGTKDKLMAQADKARGGADFQLGLSGTRIATILTKNKLAEIIQSRPNTQLTSKDILGESRSGRELSMAVGRIISTVAMMIYEKELEIENFQQEEFYELTATISNEKGTFEGKLSGFKTFDITEVHNLLKQHGLIHNNQAQGKIYKVETEEKESVAPQLHSLTSLQVLASRKWKYSPKKTLNLVQSLYEHKLVSYPRTSCRYITNAEFNYLYEHLEQYKAAFGLTFDTTFHKPRKRWVNPLKVEEHYALVLTRTVPTKEKLNELSDAERNIYFEIMRTTLGMFAPNYKYEQTTILSELNNLLFKSIGKKPLSIGFKALWGKELVESDDETDSEDDSLPVLPNVQMGDNIRGLVETKIGFTKPPKLYTEGTLIQAMETAGKLVEESDELVEIEGIGTPATRADAIESLKSHNYIVIEKQKVRPTAKCKMFCKIMQPSGMFTPTTTAKWDTFLKNYVDGEINQSYLYFIERSAAMVERFKSIFTQRINEPDVTQTINQLLDSIESSNQVLLCPKCQSGRINQVSFGEKVFYGCSNFRNEHINCNFSLSSVYNNHRFTTKQIVDLINKGITGAITFKSAKGVSYKAKVKLDPQQNKLELEFIDTKKAT